MEGASVEDDAEIISRLISLSRTILTDEEMDAIHNYISHEELPAVRSEIRQTAKRIYDNWGILESIVQRHEATIQKRWTKKSSMKRRELLLATWPNMSRDHRPDLALEVGAYSPAEFKKEAQGLLQGRARQLPMYEGSQREALLMPYINLHDLTKTEPLLLMINARARRPPHAFSKRDLQLSHPNHTGLTEYRSLKGYFMDLDGRQSVPESYGELREGEFKMHLTTTGIDPRLAAGKIDPGDGLWVLEIQDRIYKFLLHITQRILHDIPTGELTGIKYNIQPEPPLPSANSRENGTVSLSSTQLESIYSYPTQMDLHRLQLLVTAKANEEEDKLWALREDPGRFSEGLEDYIAHRPEYVPDLHGTKHHTATLEDEFYTKFLMSHFDCVEFWCDLARDITDLEALKKQHFDNRNVESGDALPEPFAVALYKLQSTLCSRVEQQLSALIRASYSSPPVRGYTRRVSPDTLDRFIPTSGRRLAPRHICDFLVFLCGFSFSGAFLRMKGHIAGVQSLMEEYDKFIDTVSGAHQAVSSYVAEEISNLALLSECLRQIHLFQPWVAIIGKDMRMLHLRAVLMAQANVERHKTTPLEQFNSSVRFRSMVATVAKSPYPAHKKRTAANVGAMQNAETLLDQMWDVLLEDMKQQNALPTHCKNVLLFQGRQLQRTPDWIEPVKPTTKTSPQIALPEALVQPFGGLSIDDNKVQDFPIEKTKIKTRGTAAPQTSTSTQVQTTEQEEQTTAHTIKVDSRALKVFSRLFHTPTSKSQPGEVPWTEFLHAMHSAGFWVEKLYGSVWQFTPRDDNGDCMAAGMRSILFHEPHPQSRIPFWHARRHGRRLARAYGWSGQTFVTK